jgi:transposase-like protein
MGEGGVVALRSVREGWTAMSAPELVNLSSLIDDARCFALVRRHRWPEGVRCPACGGGAVVRDGYDDTQAHRQRYRCKGCAGRFDDLTGTVLAGHHQPLRVWVLCLYFMGLNLSNRQIAQELGLDRSDVQAMTEALRGGLAAKESVQNLGGLRRWPAGEPPPTPPPCTSMAPSASASSTETPQLISPPVCRDGAVRVNVVAALVS